MTTIQQRQYASSNTRGRQGCSGFFPSAEKEVQEVQRITERVLVPLKSQDGSMVLRDRVRTTIWKPTQRHRNGHGITEAVRVGRPKTEGLASRNAGQAKSNNLHQNGRGQRGDKTSLQGISEILKTEKHQLELMLFKFLKPHDLDGSTEVERRLQSLTRIQ